MNHRLLVRARVVQFLKGFDSRSEQTSAAVSVNPVSAIKNLIRDFPGQPGSLPLTSRNLCRVAR